MASFLKSTVLFLAVLTEVGVAHGSSNTTTPSPRPLRQVPLTEIVKLVGPEAPAAIVQLLVAKNWNAVDAAVHGAGGRKVWTPELENIEGTSFLLRNRLPEAEHFFQRALALDPSFWRAQRNLGVTLWHEHRMSEAHAALQSALERQPQDALGNLYFGQVLFAGRDCVGAFKAFAQAGNELAHVPVAALMASECSLQKGDVRDAEDFFSKIGPEAGLPPQGLFAIAVHAAEVRDYRFAGAVLARVPADFPSPYVHGYDLALTSYQSGDDRQAANTLQQLVGSGQGTAEVLNLLGNALEEEGIRGKLPALVQQAYDAYRRGIYRDPHDRSNYLDIARLALKLRNYKLGEQLLTQGLAENPAAYQLLLERGIAYAFSSQSGHARADFAAAQKLAPNDPMPYMATGILGIQEGKYDTAAAALEHGVERAAPPNAWLEYLLARALYKEGHQNSGDATRLRSALLEAIRLNPKFTEAYGLAGQVWLKGGGAPQAINFLETAHRLDPKNSHYVYELALARRMKGDAGGAARDFAAFRELEARNNPSRMRKYFIQIFANQPPSGEGKRLVTDANP